MYGQIGRLTAVAGQRDALIDALVGGLAGMSGCLSCVVARDAADEDAIWVTEVWDSRGSRINALTLPAVQKAIVRARPMIVAFTERFETEPVGVHGAAEPADGDNGPSAPPAAEHDPAEPPAGEHDPER